MLTHRAPVLDNYLMYMGNDGIYTHTFRYEKKKDCLVCGTRQGKPARVILERSESSTLQDLIDHMIENPKLQLKRPSITCAAGVVFLQNPEVLRKQHEYKLKQTLRQLVDFGVFKEMEDLVVTDPDSLPNILEIKVKLVPC